MYTFTTEKKPANGHLLIKHKVADFAKWKDALDAFLTERRAADGRNYSLFHLDGGPDDPVLLFEWSGVENTRGFPESDELKGAMQRAGG